MADMGITNNITKTMWIQINTKSRPNSNQDFDSTALLNLSHVVQLTVSNAHWSKDYSVFAEMHTGQQMPICVRQSRAEADVELERIMDALREDSNPMLVIDYGFDTPNPPRPAPKCNDNLPVTLEDDYDDSDPFAEE